MQIEVLRESLVRELGLARRMSERKATIPVYSFARFDAEKGGEVTIAATDGEGRLETRCGATVKTPGTLLVPVKMLHEMAKSTTSEVVSIAYDGKRINVKAGGFKSTLGTMTADMFPEAPGMPAQRVVLPAPSLRDALTKVRGVVESAATTIGGHNVQGALLRIHPDHFVVVGTDGRRLSHIKVGGTFPIEAPIAVTLPRKGIDDLATFLSFSVEGDELGYYRDETRVVFVSGKRTLYMRMIDGAFPNFERVIPKPTGTTVDVDRDLLASALRRVQLLATDNVRKVQVAVQADNIELSMVSADVGDATEAVQATLTGEPWTTWFDVGYLADFLAAADGGTIRFEQKTPATPAALRSIDGDAEFLYVLSPMSEGGV